MTNEPCLLFLTPGELDLNVIRLMGVSVKETENPIGFFGTGLKYAIASALRLGGRIHLVCPDTSTVIHFEAQPVSIRGKEFSQVVMRDAVDDTVSPLGFTTDLGKQWEAWMVVRELYSNTLDEGGTISTQVGGYVPRGKTAICLTGQVFVDAWKDFDKYFIAPETVPEHSHAWIDCHRGAEGNAVFYKGIKVYELQQSTAHRYNLKNEILLTEDRTIRHPHQIMQAVEKSIIESEDEDYIHSMLTRPYTSYEHVSLLFHDHLHDELGEMFKTVCQYLDNRKPPMYNKRAVDFWRKRTGTIPIYEPVTLSSVQNKQLERADLMVRKIIGEDVFEQYEVRPVKYLGQGTWAIAHRADRCVYVTKEAFSMGTKKLTAILFEEYVHLHYGLDDETRDMQSWLFDKIITLGEEHILHEPI